MLDSGCTYDQTSSIQNPVSSISLPRHFHNDRCAFSGNRFDLKSSPDGFGSLSHMDQSPLGPLAIGLMTLWIKTPAVVGDEQANLSPILSKARVT